MSSQEFQTVAHAASGCSPLGISAEKPRLDFSKSSAWKDDIVRRLNTGVSGLLKKAKAKSVTGWCRFRDGKTVEVETEDGLYVIRAEEIVIATGSQQPVALSSLSFGGNVISSTGALALTQLPDELVVVGGGYIGLELGTAFAKLGATVTVIEVQSRILPQYDSELSQPVAKRLQELGVTVLTSAKAKGLSSDKNALLVETSDGSETTLPGRQNSCDGRAPTGSRWLGPRRARPRPQRPLHQGRRSLPDLDARHLCHRRCHR